MANEVDRLIDMLYEKIEEARPVALQTGMCKVDRDEVLDLLDELKAQFPEAEVYGHRDFAAKACPCFDARREYASEK